MYFPVRPPDHPTTGGRLDTSHIMTMPRTDDDEGDSDEIELTFITAALYSIALYNDWLGDKASTMLRDQIRAQLRLNRSLPLSKQRPTWHEFTDRITPQHFRRMFRMPLPAFTKLCSRLTDKVGESIFRPESYLITQGVLEQKPAYALNSLGGYIPGEVKVALALRMLSGSSYLDLGPLFLVSSSSVYNSLDFFVHALLENL